MLVNGYTIEPAADRYRADLSDASTQSSSKTSPP